MTGWLLQLVLPAAATLLTGAATAAVALFVKWINGKTESVQLENLNTEVGMTLTAAIGFVSAELKAGLIEAARDGQVTAEEAKKLQELCLRKAKLWFGVHGEDRVSRLLGIARPMVDEWLRGQIQVRFEQLKAQTLLPAV